MILSMIPLLHGRLPHSLANKCSFLYIKQMFVQSQGKLVFFLNFVLSSQYSKDIHVSFTRLRIFIVITTVLRLFSLFISIFGRLKHLREREILNYIWN